ncbi:MAG TPA: hypothetical protein VLM89_01195, partial [Phycisphaerae bacterium]|nr:hypothetical protein [Phycisphaerae bacterium]
GDDALAGGDGDDRTWGDGGNQAQAGNDTIWGDAGADELHGEGGDDIIIGGPGNDNIYAGFGRDTLNFSEPVPFPFIPAPVAADFTVSPATVTDEYGSTDTIFNCDNLGPGGVIAGLNCALNENLFVGRVEVVLGSSLADTIRGYADLPTEIRGGGGNDTLTGGSAADLLYGDGGDDIVEGLGGDDYLEGGGNTTAGDTVIYANATAAVRVSLGQTSAQNTGGAGYDIIAGFENLIGGAFNDVLTGDGRPNTIRGGAGDDVLNGRGDTDVVVGGITVLSQDTLDGEAGTDVADYRQGRPPLNPPPDPGGGVALDDGEGGSDVLVSIENVYLPAGAFFVSAGPDQIIPPGGSVVLPGAASGGSGNPANYRYVWDTVPPIVPPPGKTQDDCTLTVPGLNNRCIAQPTATPGATTVYRLTVTDSLPGGGLALVSSDFVRVTVAPVLVVDAGPAFSINLGQTVQLRGSVSGGVTPYTILWSPGTGLSAMNALMPTASPFSTIEYTLTVVDQTGQQVSDTTTVTVVNPFLVFAGADVAIAQGQNVQMNAAVQGGTQPLTYAWTPTTGLTSSTILNPVATPQVTTTYTVSVTDGDSREVTDSVVITVNPAALPPPDGDGQGGGGTQDGNGSGGDGQGGGGTPDGSGGTGTTPVVPFFSCGLGAGQLLAAGVCSFLSVVVVRHRRRPGGFGTG